MPLHHSIFLLPCYTHFSLIPQLLPPSSPDHPTLLDLSSCLSHTLSPQFLHPSCCHILNVILSLLLSHCLIHFPTLLSLLSHCHALHDMLSLLQSHCHILAAAITPLP